MGDILENASGDNLQVFAKNGQVWKCVGSEPYKRKDGTETTLRVWVSGCAVCGCEIKVKTPGKTTSEEGTQSFARKHCEAHKLSKVESSLIWQQAIKKSRDLKKAKV
jgi:hypothetical protein